MRLLVVALLGLIACHVGTETPDAGAVCTGLFGRPDDSTGLSADQCKPECDCGATKFAPPAYSDAFVQSLVTDWQLTTPYAPLTSDPYASPTPAAAAPGTVCAVSPQGTGTPRPYTLVTYSSEADAMAAGAIVTHAGACGLCSPLADLAVYLGQGELTGPVRSCGLQAAGNFDADVACVQKLGFDLPCAQIWAYNTSHTRSLCLQTCLENLSTSFNLPDGGLNDCLQCDEDQSGPVFKAVAGRTRRNSGIPDGICRPCDQVAHIVHAY